ncbi:hypothetical protein KSB_74530 [Ktedonobacter robiniae]|uniref:Uncharacterized protein n=1 Tax=Ktedonobacter robiniae TaxID=2778365 RepID=A0ABQ3V1Z1_9CHLR|nr:hypothetical protein KSB_74530 [Ktedonobacter robiniae]
MPDGGKPVALGTDQDEASLKGENDGGDLPEWRDGEMASEWDSVCRKTIIIL